MAHIFSPCDCLSFKGYMYEDPRSCFTNMLMILPNLHFTCSMHRPIIVVALALGTQHHRKKQLGHGLRHQKNKAD